MTGLIPFNRKHNDLTNVGFDDFSNMLEDFFTSSRPTRSLAGDTFKLDIQENEKEYKIEAEVPGVKKEDIEITFNDGILSVLVKKEESEESKNKNYIHRERRFAQMSRSIKLVDANDDEIKAKLDEGVLTIIIPKKEEIDTTKRIMIE